MTARILVVDDNPLNQKLLVAKLTHDYYIVSVADNGQAALDAVERETPDLILLDVMMPVMDGFEACRRLKSEPKTAHIPIIMVTALSDVSDRVKGLECGANDFITKPINEQALMARVRSLLRLKMFMDEWRQRETVSSAYVPFPVDFDPATDTKRKILVVNDQPMEQRVLQDTIHTLGLECVLVGQIEQALPLLQDEEFLLVIASLIVNDQDGLQLCARIRSHESTRQLPILMLAAPGDTAQVSRGLDLGVNDYIILPLEGSELTARIRTQVRQKQLYDRMRKNYETQLSLAMVDPLTGLFNRRYLDLRLPKALSRAAQNKRPISILTCDIDHFKRVNDTYGHAIGDLVLKEVAGMITNNLRPFDVVARVGGEEFIVMMPDTDLHSAQQVADRLRSRIAEHHILLEDKITQITATISIGVTDNDLETEEDQPTILKRSDEALYEAKQTGRNKVVMRPARL